MRLSSSGRVICDSTDACCSKLIIVIYRAGLSSAGKNLSFLPAAKVVVGGEKGLLLDDGLLGRPRACSERKDDLFGFLGKPSGRVGIRIHRDAVDASVHLGEIEHPRLYASAGVLRLCND